MKLPTIKIVVEVPGDLLMSFDVAIEDLFINRSEAIRWMIQAMAGSAYDIHARIACARREAVIRHNEKSARLVAESAARGALGKRA